MNKKTYLQAGAFLTLMMAYIVNTLPLSNYSVSIVAVAAFLIGCFSTAFFIRASRNERSERLTSLISKALTERVSGVNRDE